MKGRAPDPRAVRAAQLGVLALFCAFLVGLVVWIAGLIRLSLELRDIPSASIGISLVAIPVFLVLLGVVNYVFWGLRAGAAEGRRTPVAEEERHEG